MSKLPRFTNLTLVLTEQCNLRCSYCYVPKQEPHGTKVMSEEVALAAVDRFLERAPSGKDLSISFFGGEPFLARELMARVIDYARARRPRGLTFTAPTNGTLLDSEALALMRSSGMRLALSIDGTAASADRPNLQGQGTLDRVKALVPGVRDLLPVVRMTVTPENVEHLFENVTTLYSWGLPRIMHQPALERPWPREAVEHWQEQHRLLADWACERYARREPLPDLSVLEGILRRLGGAPMKYCGAGVSQAAVATDGKIYGCFRSAFDERAEVMALGSVLDETVNETLIRAYARLDPRRARPEDRDSCKSCEARDGCTVYCAAMGHVLLGDLRGVGQDACQLMRIQVDVCRDLQRRMRRLQRTSRRQASAKVAAAALALGLGVAACDDRSTVVQDGSTDQYMAPGLCAPGFECPMDAGPEYMAPGLCAPGFECPMDAAPDQYMAPGLCAPGFECPMDAASPEGLTPGVCPQPAPDKGPVDASLDGPTPGVCPRPLPDK